MKLIGWDTVPCMVAGAMLALVWLHPLPKIYSDCMRLGAHVHRMMLPVSETERFCIDNKGVIHFPGGHFQSAGQFRVIGAL
jgi:hypothetical protein